MTARRWELSIPIAPMRRDDPRPISRKDPDAKVRALAGLPPKPDTLGAVNEPDYALWLRQAGLFVKAHRPREPFVDAVFLACTFHVRPHDKIPDALLGLPHKATPDLDRYVHALQDALTEGGVWSDDRIVSASFAVKVWSKDRKSPHIDALVIPFELNMVAALLAVARGGV